MTYPSVKKTPENTSINKNRPITCLLSSTRSPAPPRLPLDAILFILFLCRQRLHPAVNDIDGQRKHNRCVLLNTYFSKGLQVAKLDRGGLSGENLGSFGQSC